MLWLVSHKTHILCKEFHHLGPSIENARRPHEFRWYDDLITSCTASCVYRAFDQPAQISTSLFATSCSLTHSLTAARNRLWVVAPSMLTGRRRVPMRQQQWVRCSLVVNSLAAPDCRRCCDLVCCICLVACAM